MPPPPDLPRLARWQPPPSWLVAGSDEPIPQPIVEHHAVTADRRAAFAEQAPPKVAARLALPQVLDTPWLLDVGKVKQLGYAGLNRYMCADWNTGPGSSFPNKRPSYAEVQRILDAGLDFWWNYEDGADDFNDGYAKWLERGQRMADYGRDVLKLPDGMGGYSSMDMDPGLQPKPVHFDSQHGFHDGYLLGPPGVYAGVPAINAFADAGTSELGWISIAKGWSHGVLPDPGKGHLDQVGSAFGGAADTNNQLQTISGSYLHATGGGEDLTSPEYWAELQRRLDGESGQMQTWITSKFQGTIDRTLDINSDTNHLMARPEAPTAAQIADEVMKRLGAASDGSATKQDVVDAVTAVINGTWLTAK